MPNRILNSSICVSDSIDALTFFQEAFFYRLLVSVDDYGNFDARAKVIRAAAFPLKDPLKDVSLEDIEEALDALEAQGMLQYYTVKGKRYIHLTGWGRFQRLRNSKHKYPGPEDERAVICDPEGEKPEETENNETVEKASETDQNTDIEPENSEKVTENDEKAEENAPEDGVIFNAREATRSKENGDPAQDGGELATSRGELRRVAASCGESADTGGECASSRGELRLARAQNPNPNPNTNPNTKDIMSGNPDDADGVSAPKQAKKAKLAQDAKLVIDYLNLKTGSKYRYSKSSTKHILARLGEGFTVDDCKSVIDKKCNEWLQDPYMSKFLRPETLFAGKFEGYLNQAPAPPRASGDRERLQWHGGNGDDLPF